LVPVHSSLLKLDAFFASAIEKHRAPPEGIHQTIDHSAEIHVLPGFALVNAAFAKARFSVAV